MGRLSEGSVVSMKNKSFSVTAEVDIPERWRQRCDHHQGGQFGGWTVYAKDGKAKPTNNALGINLFETEAETPIPGGTHQVRMEFAYDGGGLAKGGDVTLFYDGKARRDGTRRAPSRSSSPPTKRPTSGKRRGPPSRRTTPLETAGSPARSSGSSSTS